MKKFSLVTEYTESELLQIIEQCVQKVIQAELPKVISLLTNSPPTNSNSKLLTRKELKDILRLSYPTISLLTKQGILKAKIVGGSYRYLESDIHKYLENKNSERHK